MLEKWRYRKTYENLRLRQSLCNLQVHLGGLLFQNLFFVKDYSLGDLLLSPALKEEGFVHKVTLTEIPFAEALFMADGSSTRIELMSESSQQI